MTHNRPITLFRLHNRRPLQIILIKPTYHFLQSRHIIVESSNIHISRLLLVSIRVQRVGLLRFVVGEESEVLRPVSEGGGGGYECVGAGNIGGGREALEEEAVG